MAACSFANSAIEKMAKGGEGVAAHRCQYERVAKLTWGKLQSGDLVDLRHKRRWDDPVQTRVRSLLERSLIDGRGFVDESGVEYREWHWDIAVATGAIRLPPLSAEAEPPAEPTFAIRRGLKADADAIASLYAIMQRASGAPAVLKLVTDHHELVEQWREWLAFGEPIDVYLAEDEGALVGFAAAGPAAPGESRRVELLALFVAPAAQGSPVARSLLEATVGELPVQCWVPEGVERATAFLRKNGFKKGRARKLDPTNGASFRMLR